MHARAEITTAFHFTFFPTPFNDGVFDLFESQARRRCSVSDHTVTRTGALRLSKRGGDGEEGRQLRGCVHVWSSSIFFPPYSTIF